MRERVRILNICVDDISLDELLRRFDGGTLVTPNVDHMILLQESGEFRAAYEAADFVTVDSQILYWAARLIGRGVREKISGSDFLPAYYRYHRENRDIRMFLLGGRPGVAQTAADNINARVGWNMVIGAHSPSMRFVDSPDECARVVELINASGANVLVVGLGAPKQEIWIARHRERLPGVRSFMALGATLDFEAGSVRRAPPWMSAAGLEWLYRLSREPGRLWRRYLLRDIRFFALMLKQWLGVYRAPRDEAPGRHRARHP